MSVTTIEDRIKGVLTREVVVDMMLEEIDDTASLLDDIGLDSIQILELIVGLEDEFGIAVDDLDMDVELFANVRSVAETGVDSISIGALTHSVKALDISLELEDDTC